MAGSVPSLWTSQEVATALSQDVPFFLAATGISMDTRTLKPGDLYISIRGPAHDGHAFAGEAFAKGACAAIVDHPLEEIKSSPPQIVVKDTLAALSALGTFARARTQATVIAVTGSVGKTSMKELLAHVLSACGPTFASPASYNNHWGVPFSLASLPRTAVYGIFEIGMNQPGEMAPLTRLVCPHVGIITTIAEAHIGNLGSRQAIAEEKSDIFSSVPAARLAILPQDAPEFEQLKERALTFGVSQILSFGKAEKADIRLIHYQLNPTGQQAHVTAEVRGQKVTYVLPQPGEHIAVNSLVALGISEAFGLDQQKVVGRLKGLPSVCGRGQWHRIPIAGGEILLIDDAYNANLLSMQAGLSVVGAIPISPGGRRLAVLGEMLELGAESERQHAQLMKDVLAHSLDQVFAVGGPIMEKAFRTFIPLKKRGGYAASPEDLVPCLLKILQAGDILFIKGSKEKRRKPHRQDLTDIWMRNKG